MERRAFLAVTAAAILGGAGCAPRERPGDPARAWEGTLSIVDGMPKHAHQTRCILGDGQVVIEESELWGSSTASSRREFPYTEARMRRVDQLAELLQADPGKMQPCMDGAMATLELTRGDARIERSYNCADWDTIIATQKAIDDLTRG